ncbi:hypothetical protein ADIAL_0733 [Alkalibacterium sp. AK22]|nr:hypothetical protein ADIAL_0733 [Alkalibacterium sp. AK22]
MYRQVHQNGRPLYPEYLWTLPRQKLIYTEFLPFLLSRTGKAKRFTAGSIKK